MSSHSSITPRNNRRMTLSTLPPNSALRPAAVDPTAKPKQDLGKNGHNTGSSGSSSGSTGMRLPPKGRQSMIPRVGRENLNIPNTPGRSSGTTVPSTTTPSAAAAASSHTAANRRRSVSGSDNHHSSHGSSSSSMRRQSMIPPSNNYNSSGGSVTSSSGNSVGQKADPRPINDRTYQHQCMKDLLAFLQDAGYEYPISIKTLSRPSAKDFTNMTTFLLRQVDKDFQRGGMKFEDEVSLNFKCLGYPYPISKTALVAAGTPHTWPSLLAALTWLMHQLQCKSADIQRNELENDTMKDFSSIVDLETQTDRAFFQYMGQAYSAFMKGDAEALEALETAFMQRFERDDAFLAQAVERVTDLNASMVERIHEIAQRCYDLPEYKKKRESHATDVEQFHDLYRKMVDQKTQFEQKVNERTVELAQVNEKLEKMTTHINELKRSINEQEFSVEDIYKMESELNGLNEATDRAVLLRDQKRKALISAEAELAIVCNDLDTKISEFSGKIAELRLVPELGSKFSNVRVIVNKDMLSQTDHAHTIGVDLLTHIQPTAKASKNEYVSKVEQSKSQLQHLLDEANHLDDSTKEGDARLKIAGDKLSKSEQTLESERKTQEATLAVREREVEAMEKKIASLQDPVALEEQMAAYERQCSELVALRREREENNMSQKRAVIVEINQACQLMEEHEAYLVTQMSNLNQYWTEQSRGIGNVVVPTNIDATPPV